MIGTTGFATQHGLIVPAATALPGLAGLGGLTANPPPVPPTQPPITLLDAQRAALRAQKWLLFLTGVAIVDLQSTLANDWRHETLFIGVPLRGPLGRAVSDYRIARPPGVEGNQYVLAFQVEQAAPFAAPSAIFNPGSSVHAGYAVDDFRLPVPTNPLPTDALTGVPLRNLFSGIEVDLAVRNKAAVIHRVSYNIALLGKIVFSSPQTIF